MGRECGGKIIYLRNEWSSSQSANDIVKLYPYQFKPNVHKLLYSWYCIAVKSSSTTRKKFLFLGFDNLCRSRKQNKMSGTQQLKIESNDRNQQQLLPIPQEPASLPAMALALERAHDAFRRLGTTCRFRATGNPDVFCSTLPTHWRFATI